MKRTVIVLICLMMMLSLVVGCSKVEQKEQTNADPKEATEIVESTPEAVENELVNKTGFPITNEKIEVDAVMVLGPYNDGAKIQTLPIFAKMEERSNVKIVWEPIDSKAWKDKRSIMLATDNYPSMIYKGNFRAPDVVKYGVEEGIFISLTPYMEDYAPNYNKYVQEDITLKNAVTMPDGNIYSFPYILRHSTGAFGFKIFYNTKWMESLKQEYPTTLDGFYDVLVAFRDGDANKNGKADEIALTSDAGLSGIEELLKGSWGLGNRGKKHKYVDVDADGNLRFFPITESYKELLKFANKLYDDKLIDQEIFTITLADLTARGEKNTVGFAICGNNAYMGTTYMNDYRGGTPFEGPNGDRIFSAAYTGIGGVATAVVTDKCEYPEATVRWLDYFYSKEGYIDYFMGIEGETYTRDADGTLSFTDFVMKNEDGLNFEEVLGNYVCWSGGGNPSVTTDDAFAKIISDIPTEAGQVLLPFKPEEVWENFVYSTEVSEEMNELQITYEAYMKEMRANFIKGEIDIDEGWDAYVKEIEKIGLDRYMEIYQTGYENYYKVEK